MFKKKSGFESRTFCIDLTKRMLCTVSGSRRKRRSVIVNSTVENWRSPPGAVTGIGKRWRASKAKLGMNRSGFPSKIGPICKS